jgi:hypothetical protein
MLKFKGRRREAELAAEAQRLRIRGLVRSLRDALDPTVPPENLPGDLIASQAVDLAGAHVELRGLLAQIAEIDRILGG